MAEKNVEFTNNTNKVLYLKEQHFWSGTPVTAPGNIPPGSTANGKQRAADDDALKFATVYVDNEEERAATRKFISAFDIAVPKKVGPYGSQSSNTFLVMLGPDERIEEVIVKHGAIVDGIGFTVINDKSGGVITIVPQINAEHQDTIRLQSDEYITQISGTYGKYNADVTNIATLNIHTNLNQYGPFGRGELVDNPKSFSSPSGPIVGIFGRIGTYLESVGFYRSNSASSKAYAESGPFGPIDWNVVEVKLGQSKPSDVYVDNILGSKVDTTVHDNGDVTVVYSDN